MPTKGGDRPVRRTGARRNAGGIAGAAQGSRRSERVGSPTKASAGGGGGLPEVAVPRAGVGRNAPIGSLGVRNPGCGVGGVCPIVPPEIPSPPDGEELRAEVPARGGRRRPSLAE